MKRIAKKLRSNIVIKRLGATTPPFFKKVGNVLLGISAATATATATLYTLPENVYSLVPIWLLKSIGITVFFMGMFGTLITKLATDDKKLVDQQYEEDEEK